MRSIGSALVLLAATTCLSAATLPQPSAVDCNCHVNYSLTWNCTPGCSIIIYDLQFSDALCEHPACIIIPGNVCVTSVLFAFAGTCSSGQYSLLAKAPCDGTGSTSKRCPGGIGTVQLDVECASTCTQY